MGLILPLPLANYKALCQGAFNWGQISKFVVFINAVTLIFCTSCQVRLPLTPGSAPQCQCIAVLIKMKLRSPALFLLTDTKGIKNTLLGQYHTNLRYNKQCPFRKNSFLWPVIPRMTSARVRPPLVHTFRAYRCLKFVILPKRSLFIPD